MGTTYYKMSTQDSGNSQPLFPSLCKNGCGFFSGIDSKGFCSVCYKKYLKKEAAEKSEAGEADDTTSAVLAQLSLEEAPAKVNPEEGEASLAEGAGVPPVAEVKAEAIAEDHHPPLMEPQAQPPQSQLRRRRSLKRQKRRRLG